MLKSAKIFILSLPFILLLIEFFHPIYALEEDLGRHLLFGEIIIKTLKIPHTNLISYTFTDYPYVLNHWLSEAVYFLIVKIAGFEALLIFAICVFIASFGILYLYLIHKINPFILALMGIIYVSILFERSTIRPEMFGFLLLTISITIYYLYRKKFSYLIFLLIPLQLLWVNFQINFPFGPLIGTCFLIEELILDRKRIVKERNVTKHAFVLFSVIFLTTLVSLVNPNFIKGFLYPLTGYKDIGHPIKELQSIFTVQTFYPRLSHVMFSIAATILGVGLFFSKKIKIADTIIAIIFIILGVTAVRNIPFFVFATFIAVCIHLNDSFENFIIPKLNKMGVDNLLKLKLLAAICLIVLTCILSYFVVSVNGFGFGINKNMSYAADFFVKNSIKGTIFNDVDSGQYLAYRLYPREKIFIDVRETYPAAFFKDVYYPMLENSDKFEEISTKYKINAIIFSHLVQIPETRKFVKRIVNDPRWVMVYLDDSAVILVKNTSQNSGIINKFGMKRKKVILSHHDYGSEASIMRLARFFIFAGWGEHAVSMYKKNLQINPNSCTALYNLSTLYKNKDINLANNYELRHRQVCE